MGGQVLLTHGDSLDEEGVAQGFRVIARSGPLVAGMEYPQKRLYGVQFHPEVHFARFSPQCFYICRSVCCFLTICSFSLVYALHPQVDLTEHGKQIFENFLLGIAGLEATFTVEDRLQKAVDEIRENLGDDKKALALVR